jgi:hypothetical protein
MLETSPRPYINRDRTFWTGATFCTRTQNTIYVNSDKNDSINIYCGRKQIMDFAQNSRDSTKWLFLP